jgi:hypothetical protein
MHTGINTNGHTHTYRKSRSGKFIFDGRLQWDFREKSLAVSKRNVCEKSKKAIQYTVKATFGSKNNGDSLWDLYDGFTHERSAQHDKIKDIVDAIFNAYFDLYGSPCWTMEEGSR